MRHDGWYIAAALSIGTIAALALLEVGLRLAAVPTIEAHRRGPVTYEEHRRFFVYDPELGWRGRPRVSGPFSGWEFVTQVHLNELGFRDINPWQSKQPNQYEVLLLGDSITWGYGVEEGRRYADLLPQELAKLGINVVVRNAAMPGYDTGQELLLYRQLKGRGCTDLVLIGLYANDLWENGSSLQGPYAKPYFVLHDGRLHLTNVPVPQGEGWKNRESENGASWITRMKKQVRLVAGAAWLKETVRLRFGSTTSASPQPQGHNIEITRALLRKWAAELERDHLASAVVVLPDAVGLENPGPLTTDKAATHGSAVPVLRLTDAFREARQKSHQPLFFRLDGAHWTEEAHEVAARSLASLLKEAGLFRGAPKQCRTIT